MSLSHSESLENIAPALVKAQAAMRNVANDAANPAFRHGYTSLGAFLDAVKPILAEHGFSLSQHPGTNDTGFVTLETLLLHESGEWLRSEAATPIEKATAQGIGSAITYLRRYSLAAILNITQEDDDGQQASRGRGGQAKRQEPRPAPPPAAEKPAEKSSGPTSKEIGDVMRTLNVSVGDMASIYNVGAQGEAVVAFVREQVAAGKTVDQVVRHASVAVAERKARAYEEEKAAKKAQEETVDDVERAILAEHAVPAREGA